MANTSRGARAEPPLSVSNPQTSATLTVPHPSAIVIKERLEDARMRVPNLTDIILARTSEALRTRHTENLERAANTLVSVRRLAGAGADRATEQEICKLEGRINIAKAEAAAILRPSHLTMTDVPPISREKTNEVISAMQSYRHAFWKRLWAFPGLQHERIETLARVLDEGRSLPRFVFIQRGKPFSEAGVSALVRQAKAAHQSADFDRAGALLADLPTTPERALEVSSQLERDVAGFLDGAIRQGASSSSQAPDDLDALKGYLGGDPLEVRKRLNQMVSERQRYLACKEYLFVANERLVLSFTRPTGELRLYNEDFFQESRTGLMKAIERFDASSGNALSTAAVSWIRDSQSDQTGDYCSGISIPKQSRWALSRLRSALAGRASGQEETLQSLAASHNLGPDTMRAVLLLHGGVLNLESSGMLGDGLSGSWRERFEAGRSHASEAPLEAQEITGIVQRLLEGLSFEERTAIEMIFGIGYDDTHTVREVSERLGLGARKINNMKDRVLRNLRKTLESRGVEDDLLP